MLKNLTKWQILIDSQIIITERILPTGLKIMLDDGQGEPRNFRLQGDCSTDWANWSLPNSGNTI